MQIAGRLSPEEFWARIAVTEQRMRDSATILPGYGLAEWTGLLMVGDWEWENGRLATVGFAHGDPSDQGPAVHVRTTVHDPRDAVASLRMGATRAPREKDEFLRRRREADIAPTEAVDISMDGVPLRFDVWRDSDQAWVAAEHGGYGLILQVRRVPIDRLELVQLHDLEPYIAGRRAYLRTLRGES